MDSFTSSPTNASKGGRPKTAGGPPKRGASAKGGFKKYESGESKRAKRAEINKKTLFVELKRLIDKAEETASSPGGAQEIPVIPGQASTNFIDVKTAIRDKRLLRFFCGVLMNNR